MSYVLWASWNGLGTLRRASEDHSNLRTDLSVQLMHRIVLLSLEFRLRVAGGLGCECHEVSPNTVLVKAIQRNRSKEREGGRGVGGGERLID